MSNVNPQIEESWKEVLIDEFNKPYFSQLKNFLVEEKKRYTIYPPGSLIFNAFNKTPFHKVKVILLGQDPYHGKGQAHGLCFSVPDGVQPPPSLINIFKEINSDIGTPVPQSGNLERWAGQGVLLLNAILTVRAGLASSHREHGWEQFTDAVIHTVSEKKQGIVFLLWGKYARGKKSLIDNNKHLILEAPHPSPYSADYGFFGCRHFSKTNNYLLQQGKEPVKW
ncbi:MAG: uracil-DNA glycosylase [Chlorobi bacterium]|nr:uracil-DNA glycosylase [Chlorobiota bacterium]